MELSRSFVCAPRRDDPASTFDFGEDNDEFAAFREANGL
jgi:hypothetical protein